MSSEILEMLEREDAGAGGFPTRRAGVLLHAIESRVAYLVLQARNETSIYRTAAIPSVPDEAAPGGDAFLEALAQGRDVPIQPTIQDLEQYAPQWAGLVPSDANLRAALALRIGDKYLFTYNAVPSMRHALGLDSDAVQQAYQTLYSQPLTTIYAPTISRLDHLRWTWARLNKWLENLPPFWIAFALTLPGAPGLLALPIALAGIGPLGGIALVILFGVVNMVTVAALAESVARSGTTRFGLGFLGQLVEEYLGNAGSVLLTAVLAVNNFLVLIIFYLGAAGTLESSTRLPTVFWVTVLFGVCLYFLTRRSLNSTVSSALLIVLINLAVIVIIPLLTLPHFQAGNLAGSVTTRQSLDPALWGPVVGVMLATFFSHFLVASYAPVVLRRDPSARAWVGGSVAAIFVFMLIAVLWMVAVNGAIPAGTLTNETGTVLEPLEGKVGPGVQVLGSLLVILSLGLAAIQVSLGLYYIVEERLPASRGPSGRGRFLLSISPVIVAFLLAQWLAINGIGSFANLLGTQGAMALPLLGGIFPILLLAATRRKGDFVPRVVSRFLGNPIVIAATFLFFLATIFAHGLVIWQDPLLRALAIVFGLVILGVTVLILQRGALQPRVVIELRQDRRLGMRDEFNITADGKPSAAAVKFEYVGGEQHAQDFTGSVPEFATLRAASFELPALNARRLKVWAHQITPDGRSRGLPLTLQVNHGNGKTGPDLKLANGLAEMAWGGDACMVRLVFP